MTPRAPACMRRLLLLLLLRLGCSLGTPAGLPPARILRRYPLLQPPRLISRRYHPAERRHPDHHTVAGYCYGRSFSHAVAHPSKGPSFSTAWKWTIHGVLGAY